MIFILKSPHSAKLDAYFVLARFVYIMEVRRDRSLLLKTPHGSELKTLFVLARFSMCIEKASASSFVINF